LIDRRAKFLILVAFLVVSIGSLRSLPALTPWGADLQNLLLYHHCAIGRSPYTVSAHECGDPWNRGLYYPPLLFRSYIWTRSLTLHVAIRIWTVFQIAAFLGVLVLWSRRLAAADTRWAGPEPRAEDRTDLRWEIPIFCGLLLFQYPFAFTLERGGSDVWAVVAVTLAALFLVKKQHFAAGVALGLATAYKLYPLFACAVIVSGLLLAAWRSSPGATWRLRLRSSTAALSVAAGAALTFAAVFLVFWRDSRRYFFAVLPEFSTTLPWTTPISHSLTSVAGAGHAGFARLVFAGVAGVWVWAAGRAFQRGEIATPVAGALALSTYLQATSYDYNLVTTYPLLLLTFLKARATDRWGVLALGLLSIVGERQLFADQKGVLLNPTTHVLLQVAFLVQSAVLLASDAKQADPPGRATNAAPASAPAAAAS
jgi:hypothetical protein